MLFNSFNFVYFFGVVFVLYYLTPHRFRWIVLLTGSYYFYATWKLEYLIYLIVPTIVVYGLALKIEGTSSGRARKLLLGLGIGVPLGLLFTFKYLDLFVKSFASLFSLQSFKPLNLLLPIGISFYTFKLLSYIIDVYNENLEPERHVGIFALYVSFFPQLLAGPIDRAVRFIPELKKRVHLDWERVGEGLRLVMWGLFKKIVIADRMALFVNQVFRNPAHYRGLNLIFALYFYSFQIYCDFSGYSDIAIGLSRMLGLKSMDNFNFPYFSKNLSQFWNRWHISLSTWLRDYLFLPIAYAILRLTRREKVLNIKFEEWAYAGGIGITMLLGGLWHGANWTFVIWGILHGMYLAAGRLFKRIKKRLVRKTGLHRWPRFHRLIGIFFTFHLVTFAWVFFRSPSFDHALLYIKNLNFNLSGSGLVHLLYTLFFVVAFVVMEIILKNRQRLTFLDKIPLELKIAGYMLFVCLMIVFSVDSSNEFIYFQF
jgi:alginate O-acetyltransferase complex protein AlgI